MKKITIFSGHFGSGKTNLAVNAALELKKREERVILCDMDIVNPYFRTKDSAGVLEAAGVRLISPEFANTNVDLPYLSAEIHDVFGDAFSVMDVGGDDAGAIALGQYAERISASGYDMFLVLNARRYLTLTPEEAISIMKDIQRASKLKFTGLVNNTNLGRESSNEVVEKSREYVHEVSDITGLPVIATSFRRDLSPKLDEKDGKPWPIDIYDKPGWAIW